MPSVKVISIYYFNIILQKAKFNKFLPKRPSIVDQAAYSEWRMRSVENEIGLMEALGVSVMGKTVMDFGCGEGGKLVKLHELNPSRLIGVDIDASSLEYAATLIFSKIGIATDIELIKTTPSAPIPLPTSSIDVIICLDVLEHISNLASVSREWHRVLKADGKIFFKYQPNESPYGHHADRIIAVPWIQCVLSEGEMGSLFHRTKTYWKKSHEWMDPLPVLPYINNLKVTEILQTVKDCGFTIDHFDLTPLEGNTNKWARMLSRITFLLPRFQPYFSCRAAGVLVKSK